MNKLDFTKKRLKKELLSYHPDYRDIFSGSIDEIIQNLKNLQDEFHTYNELHLELEPENSHYTIYINLTGYRKETEEEVLKRINSTKERLASKLAEADAEKAELKELQRLLKKFKDKI